MRILNKLYRKISVCIARARLKNSNFSIICPTCIGGVICHWLGVKFLSPTVNLFMSEVDFMKLAKDIKFYMNSELVYVCDSVDSKSGQVYPVGKISGRNGKDDVLIHFNHYTSFDEAKSKWDDRKKRIQYDNLFYIFSNRDATLTEGDISSLQSIEAKGVVCFVSKEYPELSYALVLRDYLGEGHVGSYMIDKIRPPFYRLVWEKDFDYVHWLNTGEIQKKRWTL